MKKYKIVGIISSPRKESTTSYIVKRSLDGFKAKGHDITLIDVNNQNIPFSTGVKSSAVKPSADAQKIGKAIQSADILLFGVPNYWSNMPAQLKIVFDNISPYLVDLSGKLPKGLLKKKKALVVTACAAPSFYDVIKRSSAKCFLSVASILKVSGIKRIEHFSYSNTNKQKVTEDKELHNEISIMVQDLL